jgi:uncharacterized protein (TIGR00369 family)
MIKTYNPDFKNTINEKLGRQFFMQLLGFKITKIEEGIIEGELELQQAHKQHKGFVHGGVIATVADIVMGFSAVSLVQEDNHVVTVELKTSYLNPGIGEKLFAKGWVLKQGRKLNFCEAEVYAFSEGKEPVLVAKASATMATLTPEDVKK